LGENAISGSVWKLVSTVIDLNGEWKFERSTQSSLVSVSGSTFKVDNSSQRIFNIGDWAGVIVDASTVTIVDDSGRTVTGKLEPPGTMRLLWPSGGESIWRKVEKPKVMAPWLEGEWIPEGGFGRDAWRISKSDQSITIHNPDGSGNNAHGSVINDSLIRVTFPDNQTYDGNIGEHSKIKWSNNTVWVRFIREG